MDSTLRRRIPTYSPLAYWPMEEGATATQAYSPIAGVGPMAVTDMSFASSSDLGGSGPLPTLGDNARFFGGVRPGANGQWQVELVYNLEALPASLTTMLLVRTTGSTPRILVQIQTTNVKLVGQDAAGDEVWFINLTPPDFVGQWNRLQVMHSTSGGTITAKIGWVTIGQGGQYGQTTYPEQPAMSPRLKRSLERVCRAWGWATSQSSELPTCRRRTPSPTTGSAEKQRGLA